MLQPNFRYFRKPNRHHLRYTYENKSNKLCFGVYGLQAVEKGFLTVSQIEAVRRTIISRLKRKSKVWIRAYPSNIKTAKPKETRIGKGKGNLDHWYCAVKPGRILFEISSSHRYISLVPSILEFAKQKLPIETQIISYQFKELYIGFNWS